MRLTPTWLADTHATLDRVVWLEPTQETDAVFEITHE